MTEEAVGVLWEDDGVLQEHALRTRDSHDRTISKGLMHKGQREIRIEQGAHRPAEKKAAVKPNEKERRSVCRKRYGERKMS